MLQNIIHLFLHNSEKHQLLLLAQRLIDFTLVVEFNI